MSGLDRLNGRAVPVIRMQDPAHARAAIGWLREGGIDVFEITASVPDFDRLIAELAAEPGLFVGAGTILDRKVAIGAIEAGARFIVSPCIVPEVIETCTQAGIPMLPGTATPTEVLSAHRAGAPIVKVFPAKQLGGAGYLAALRSVFPHIPLMPTGGITIEEAPGYFRAGAVAVGMGGQLVTEDEVKAGHREVIVERARRLAGMRAGALH
jgi:2-dehydro-3-deoxyphosphogluconate aldolase / (4S)-4-hydroxy-2-oxoglutarate aldolase